MEVPTFLNTNRSIADYIYPKCAEIYKHAPSAYDIGIRALRTATLATLAYSNILLTGESAFTTLTACGLGYIAVTKEIIPTLREWSVRKLTEDQSKENVVLFCRTTRDFNGAATSLSSSDLAALEEFSKTHSIVLKKVSGTDDINTAIHTINATGRKITTLWICAHGSPEDIQLGNEEVRGEDTDHLVEKKTQNRAITSMGDIHFRKLTKDADIVLSACSVAGDLGGTPNLAEWTQYYAGPHRKVHAPTHDLRWNGTSAKFSTVGEKPSWTFKSLLGLDITADVSYDRALSKTDGIAW